MSSTFCGSRCPPTACRSRLIPSLVILFACLSVSPFAGAVEIYKWVDKSGKVHYGDRADDAAGGSKIDIDADVPPPDPGEATREDRSRKLLQDIEQDRSDREAKAKAKHAEEQKRKRNCAIARERLNNFENAGFLYDLDKNGQRRILSDAEYDQALAKSRKDVDSWCRPAGDAH